MLIKKISFRSSYSLLSQVWVISIPANYHQEEWGQNEFFDSSLGFVNTFIWLLVVIGFMRKADDAHSIQSTWSCYCLDQFLTQILNT